MPTFSHKVRKARPTFYSYTLTTTQTRGGIDRYTTHRSRERGESATRGSLSLTEESAALWAALTLSMPAAAATCAAISRVSRET